MLLPESESEKKLEISKTLVSGGRYRISIKIEGESEKVFESDKDVKTSEIISSKKVPEFDLSPTNTARCLSQWLEAAIKLLNKSSDSQRAVDDLLTASQETKDSEISSNPFAQATRTFSRAAFTGDRNTLKELCTSVKAPHKYLQNFIEALPKLMDDGRVLSVSNRSRTTTENSESVDANMSIDAEASPEYSPRDETDRELDERKQELFWPIDFKLAYFRAVAGEIVYIESPPFTGEDLSNEGIVLRLYPLGDKRYKDAFIEAVDLEDGTISGHTVSFTLFDLHATHLGQETTGSLAISEKEESYYSLNSTLIKRLLARPFTNDNERLLSKDEDEVDAWLGREPKEAQKDDNPVKKPVPSIRFTATVNE